MKALSLFCFVLFLNEAKGKCQSLDVTGTMVFEAIYAA